MQINNYMQRNSSNRSQHDVNLQLLLSQPTDKQLRPCPGCDVSCSCDKHSTTCCCDCSVRCLYASRKLSSEPDKYPIEPKILSLVYGLSTLRLLQPCWSCEGHTDGNNQLQKIPQVWFYSSDVVYPQLVSQHLQNLKVKNKLADAWHVTVSPFSADNFVGTFIITPVLRDGIANISLESLQNDIQVISSEFTIKIRRIAFEMLNFVKAA